MYKTLETSNFKIIFTNELEKQLNNFLKNSKFDKIFVLTDSNVYQKVIQQSLPMLQNFKTFIIEPGEQSKNIHISAQIWDFLAKNYATRNSLLINVGGGVVSDLGGFVASTFKRGIKFINIPTSLLAQVDASVGGKCGINHLNIKNLIGCFNNPLITFIDSNLLKTLPHRHFISGFAEMIKHALIASKKYWSKLKSFDLQNIDYDYLSELIYESVNIKFNIVKQDPLEQNLRKTLNFGHTIGHAIEALYADSLALLHGEAIAIGMITETYLSNIKLLFSISNVLEISSFIIQLYPNFKIPYKDYEKIIELIKNDKKNINNSLVFILLHDIGQPEINQSCSESEIIEALHFYNQLQNYH